MFSSNSSQVSTVALGSGAIISWSAADTSGSVSGTNNTVWTNSSNSNYANTRAELPSSGKHYFEVITGGTIDNNGSLGLMSMNNTPTYTSAFWDSSNCTHRLIRRGNGAGSDFQEADNGDGSLSGDNTTSHPSVSWTSDPVVFMVAWDGDNKRAWMGINGVWINSQTPSSSSSTGAQNWSAVTSGRVGIAASAYSATCTFTIREVQNHSYVAPTGFTPGGGGGTGGGGGGSLTISNWYYVNTGGGELSFSNALSTYSAPPSFITDNSAGTTGSLAMQDKAILVKFSGALTSAATATLTLGNGSYSYAGYSTSTSDLSPGTYSSNIATYNSYGNRTFTIPSGARWFYVGTGEGSSTFSNLYITGGGLT